MPIQFVSKVCQGHTSLSFSVNRRECHEGAAENDNIGKGKGKALPIDVEHDEKWL